MPPIISSQLLFQSLYNIIITIIIIISINISIIMYFEDKIYYIHVPSKRDPQFESPVLELYAQMYQYCIAKVPSLDIVDFGTFYKILICCI